MQITVPDMLSVGSLSAFTASFIGDSSVGRARPVRETREVGRQDTGAIPGRTTGTLSPDQGRAGQNALQPGIILPRGSLLDLSV